MAATCMYMWYFFPEIWETVVLVLLPKVIQLRIVFSILYSTAHQICYGSYHILVPRPPPPSFYKRERAAWRWKLLQVATGKSAAPIRLQHLCTWQNITLIGFVSRDVLWLCTDYNCSHVCDQAGDKCKDKQNRRGLAIARHCWQAFKTKQCGSFVQTRPHSGLPAQIAAITCTDSCWCLLKTLSPAFLLSKVSPYWTEPTWWFCHRSSHRSAGHCCSQLYYTIELHIKPSSFITTVMWQGVDTAIWFCNIM